MLKDHQITHFQTFGFIILHGFLTADEVIAADREFDTGLARAEALTKRHGIRKQLNWSNLGIDTPFLGSLLEDARFHTAAKQLLGGKAIGHYANGNLFDGDRTEWHPDTGHLSRRGIKFAFYLQPLDECSGALRLIPGSHKAPLHSDIRKISLRESNKGTIDAEGLAVEEMPAYVARSQPEDVIAFDNRIWHASWGGKPGRRMCSVGYFASPESPDEKEAIRQIAEDEAKRLAAMAE